MNELRKIVIYSEVGWDFLDQRHHHLARYFANKGHNVEFVERVVSRVPTPSLLLKIIKPKNKLHTATSKKIPNNISLRRSLFLPHVYILFSIYNYLVWLVIERRRQKGAVVYSFVDNPYVVGGRLSSLATYEISVFDIIHNWWHFPWKAKQHKKQVERCLGLFSKIVTDSPLIQNQLLERGLNSHLMMPGVDGIWFDKSATKLAIAPVFFGNLRSNSDLELVSKIDDNFELSLYGLIDESIAETLSKCAYKGQLDPSVLVNELSNYNVIILPYNKSEFSQSISPAKYFESLATGSLVVTGSDLGHLPGANTYVLNVDHSSGDFFERLTEAMQDHSVIKADQVEFAREHTWQKRFDKLTEYLLND